MAFDQSTRNRLSRFVGDARSLLSEEFTRQLQHEYGMDPDSGEVADLDRLTQLDDAHRETARILRDTLQHYLAGDTVPDKKAYQDALQRIVREQAFTVLNRLSALRMMEARGLLLESIGKGYQSRGFQLYSRLAGSALGETGDAYRVYLFSLFDEFAVDLAVLFDRFSPQGRLFPRESVLLELLEQINDPDIAPLWAEDETIGWIYQYFNSQEERRQMRAESQAPRNSRELAVRNQFFTPRYVVEFLTDNTLGRIWYEMTKGKTSLVDQCQYLVRRPKEVFLGHPNLDHSRNAEWVRNVLNGDFSAMPEHPPLEEIGDFALLIDGYEVAHTFDYGEALEFGSRHMQAHTEEGQDFPADSLALWLILFAYQRSYLREGWRGTEETDPILRGIRAVYDALRNELQHPPDDLSQDELLKQSVFIPHRPMKDPREITMLDPACGSMHFGLYAFDLYETIYQEAWERGLVPREEFGYRTEPELLHDSVRPNPQRNPTSNYSNEQVPFDDAYVVATKKGDFGDGVHPDKPYIVSATTNFRVPVNFRVKLSDFDYQAALSQGVFDESDGEDMVRLCGGFDYDELPAVSEEDAHTNYVRQIPRLIIERNIHGIDIDPRAVQIAGLSLWLRAQRSWQRQGLKAQERPVIRKSNIVCAEPMPGDKAQLDEFLKGLREERLETLIRKVLDVPENQRVRATPTMADALCELVSTVWHEMELAGEAGSLLKIEESLAAAIDHARNEWEQRLPLFRVETFRMTEGADEKPKVNYLRTVPGEEEDFWDRAEALVLTAMEEYANQAAEAGFTRRLFVADAARGFSFVDLCRKRYDVVLMNPPFGDASRTSKRYLETTYSDTKNDLFACMIERCLGMQYNGGKLGVISNMTGFFLQSFAAWRRLITSRPHGLELVASLGYGVLDTAMVSTAAYTIGKSWSDSVPNTIFFQPSKQDDFSLLDMINDLEVSFDSKVWIWDVEEFHAIPNMPICYFITNKMLSLYSDCSRLSPEFAHIYQGIATGNNERFLRVRWEVNPERIDDTWLTYVKGGESVPWYQDQPLLVSWQDNGAEAKANAQQAYGSASRTIKNEVTFLKPGLTYTQVTNKGFFPRTMPAGCVYDMKGPLILARVRNPLVILAVLASLPIRALAYSLTDGRQWHPTSLMNLPFPDLDFQSQQRLRELAQTAVEHVRKKEMAYENTAIFLSSVVPRILDDDKLARITAKIDAIVADSYGVSLEEFDRMLGVFVEMIGISSSDAGDTSDTSVELGIPSEKWLSYTLGCSFGRWDINHINELASSVDFSVFDSLPACPPGMLQNNAGLPASPKDVSDDYPLRISWPGILVDDPGHPEDIVGRVREALAVIWPDNADAIEQEACEILGVDSLRTYFANPNLFFADHLKRYSKSRRVAPIYWPLSTPSGSYTLWLYYHRLSDQMLYTCVNDFVDPKLREVTDQFAGLRSKTGRSRIEEKALERLSDLELELRDFRTELLRIAAFWEPNLNDGVQITAAPLWQLFRHRQWQKRLRTTWEKLENGDYDWAHLAMSVWPARVVPKCVDDRSLAIAHDVEDLFWVEDAGKWRPLRPPAEEIEDQKRRHGESLSDEQRERVLKALTELAENDGYSMSGQQVAQHLAEGDWDDTEVALLFWPERVAEKCLDDPFLADNLRINLPPKRTKTAVKRWTKQLVEAGCPDQADALLASLDEEDATLSLIIAELKIGGRDHAPLALALYPERVVDQCTADADLAEIHGLRRFFWVQNDEGAWRRRVAPQQEVVDEAARRS